MSVFHPFFSYSILLAFFTQEGYHIDRYSSLYDEIIFLLHHKNGNRMRVVAKSGKTYLIKNGKIVKIV